MNKLNFENLDLIREELIKLNTGKENINYQNLSFLSHELYLYLQAWTLNPTIKWEEFKNKNHLLTNENLHNENKHFNLNVLIDLRNKSYYKTLSRTDSFKHLKSIYQLETNMLKENKKVFILKESIEQNNKTG